MTKILEKLWKPQQDAVKSLKKYLPVFQKGKTKKSALIHMPTGSGKTGVMAYVSRLEMKKNNVLIVSPRVTLREQLFKEINTDFWNKINETSSIPKKVIELTDKKKFPSVIKDASVFITTIHKLHFFATNNSTEFIAFAKNISLILFDEGHVEPAHNWSKTIRQFSCAKVIFTATPFRNDFKQFDIDSDFIYSYTFHKAVSSNILRRVKVVTQTPTDDCKKFINDVDDFARAHLNTNDRIIIRCEKKETIEKLAIECQALGLSFVGIHHDFPISSSVTWQHKKVPDFQTTDAKYWIHQYKLMEGVDDPRFRLLAIYNTFKNTRSLIQQIGRIVRNPNHPKKGLAYFLDHSRNEMQKKMWESYLEYDKKLEDGFSVSVGDFYYQKVFKNLPSLEYVDKKFREKLEYEKLTDLKEEIQLPLSTNLLEIDAGFKINDLCSILENRFNENDFPFQKYDIDPKTVLYLYVSYSNSSFLTEKYFLDTKLNVCIFKDYTSVLAFYDSKGFVPLGSSTIKGSIASEKIRLLVNDVQESKLTQVGLQNSNFNRRAIQSHSFSASSIDETTPFLDDHAQIISTAVGYSKESTNPIERESDMYRRYLGFKKGRITESSKRILLKNYLEWLDYLVGVVSTTSTKTNDTFKRYSNEKQGVKELEPKSILLDFSEIDIDSFKKSSTDEDVYFDGLFAEVQEEKKKGNTKYYFELSINDLPKKIFVEVDTTKRKYKLSSVDLDEIYFGEDKQNLSKYLNQNQSFRIIPKENNTIYAYGQFYEPSIKIGSRFKEKDFQVGKIIYTDAILDKIGNEKGKQCQPYGRGWDKDSLFHLVDDCFSGTSFASVFGNPDLLVCDDMNTEVADFILSDEKKVVFIHVKGVGNKTKGSKCSASSLQEVCGQAVKNIQFLSMFNSLKPKHLNRWDKKWPSAKKSKSKKIKGSVRKRIRKGSGTPNAIWKILQERISNPTIDREVWLVLGKTLEKKELIKYLGRTNPKHEAVQAAVLLHATMTSVSSIGARLRIFCSP